MLKPVILKADGRMIEYPPANGKTFTLDELKKAIGGGYIELARTSGGHLLVIDEEGKLKGFELNTAASLLYINYPQDQIVGDALLCDPSMIE